MFHFIIILLTLFFNSKIKAAIPGDCNILFATSRLHHGDFGMLENADNECRMAANRSKAHSSIRERIDRNQT